MHEKRGSDFDVVPLLAAAVPYHRVVMSPTAAWDAIDD